MNSLFVRVLILSLVWFPSFAAAQSWIGDVDGSDYDFSVLSAGYISYLNDAEISAQIESTPWWGNQTLAETFAGAVGANLGTDSDFNSFYYNGTTSSSVGPAFVYSAADGFLYSYWDVDSASVATQEFRNLPNDSLVAIATPVPEINGNALVIILFILGVFGLALRRRTVGSDLSQPVVTGIFTLT